MDIKISSYIQHYVGPSQSYYNAQNRFDSILKYKLGIFKEDKNLTDENIIFDYGDTKTENTEDSVVFSDNSKISKDSFSSVKPLVKTVGSILINGILDTTDVRKKSNYSAEYLNSKLSGTPLEGLGEDFKRAEDLYGINSIVLMSMAKLESNFGRSKIALDKNNLFGYQAYDSSPYTSAKSYNTKKDSIYDVAKHLSNNYLSPNGDYFNGYSVDAIGLKYSTDSSWASKVKKIASELIKA
ncbi:MAG: glucosaminidase domain-containing protein [Peptoanaerobacter stomatis]